MDIPESILSKHHAALAEVFYEIINPKRLRKLDEVTEGNVLDGTGPSKGPLESEPTPLDEINDLTFALSVRHAMQADDEINIQRATRKIRSEAQDIRQMLDGMDYRIPSNVYLHMRMCAGTLMLLQRLAEHLREDDLDTGTPLLLENTENHVFNAMSVFSAYLTWLSFGRARTESEQEQIPGLNLDSVLSLGGYDQRVPESRETNQSWGVQEMDMDQDEIIEHVDFEMKQVAGTLAFDVETLSPSTLGRKVVIPDSWPEGLQRLFGSEQSPIHGLICSVKNAPVSDLYLRLDANPDVPQGSQFEPEHQGNEGRVFSTFVADLETARENPDEFEDEDMKSYFEEVVFGSFRELSLAGAPSGAVLVEYADGESIYHIGIRY